MNFVFSGFEWWATWPQQLHNNNRISLQITDVHKPKQARSCETLLQIMLSKLPRKKHWGRRRAACRGLVRLCQRLCHTFIQTRRPKSIKGEQFIYSLAAETSTVPSNSILPWYSPAGIVGTGDNYRRVLHSQIISSPAPRASKAECRKTYCTTE